MTTVDNTGAGAQRNRPRTADMVSDSVWAIIEPVFPTGGGRGRPWNDHRRTLEGILWRSRTGLSWRQLPARFGPWPTAAKRHLLWSSDGTYREIAFAVGADGDGQHTELLLALLSANLPSGSRTHGAGSTRPASGRRTQSPRR